MEFNVQLNGVNMVNIGRLRMHKAGGVACRPAKSALLTQTHRIVLPNKSKTKQRHTASNQADPPTAGDLILALNYLASNG